MTSSFHLLAVRNTTKFSPALFEPDAETRHDWEIFFELQTRMERKGLVQVVRKRRLIKTIPRTRKNSRSGFAFWTLRREGQSFFERFDFAKAQESCSRNRSWPIDVLAYLGGLRTADKQIELAPEVLVKDVERVKAKFAAEIWLDNARDAAPISNGHLLLIGRRQLRSNNSWMHNSRTITQG